MPINQFLEFLQQFTIHCEFRSTFHIYDTTINTLFSRFGTLREIIFPQEYSYYFGAAGPSDTAINHFARVALESLLWQWILRIYNIVNNIKTLSFATLVIFSY